MPKIVIDTDIGDDVDDALALAYALRHTDIDLVAVTTVFRDVETRAKLALKLLKTFGRDDIPVAAGLGRPLMGSVDDQPPQQIEILDVHESLPAIDSQHGVDLLVSVLKQGGVTPVTIGPMTNMAAALMKDQSLKDVIPQFVVMGGVVGQQGPEWNIACDPDAARICFESGVPIVMVGLDVTQQCVMSQEQVDRIAAAGTPQADLLGRFISVWKAETERNPTLHDPLAVALTADRSFVSLLPRLMEVETSGEFTRGITVAREGELPNAVVALEVEAERFTQHFTDTVLS